MQPTLPQQPKIIFFDIDHTLYQTEQGVIPASITELVIPRLKAKGIIPAIATGRNLGAFPKPLQALVARGDFELLVTINGQYNRYKDQIISKYPLELERVQRLTQDLDALKIDYAFVSDEQVAASAFSPELDAALKPIKPDYIIAPDYYHTHEVVQLMVFYPEARLGEVLASGLLGEDLKEVRWHPFSVDILRKGNSKAHGITDVLAHFGWTMNDAMAFGDGLNDMEMLQTVGFGVAMGNAHPSLKAVADFVAESIDQDGILKALETLGVI